MFRPILIHYVDSPSMLQKFLAAVVTEEWARECDVRTQPNDVLLLDRSLLARDLATKVLQFLQGEPPSSYHEMMYTLARLHAECFALLHAFNHDCKLPVSMIPNLGQEIDITGTRADAFTISTAQKAVGEMFDKLKDALGRTKKKELAIIKEKREHVAANIERYAEVKAQYDIRVSAAFAAAFVGLKATPDKVSPIVKGIMNGIKVSSTFSALLHHTLKLVLERREHPASNPFSRCRRRFRRLLCPARAQPAARENRQEPLYIPLPGRRADADLRL